jgi:hypothetical protein
MAAKSAFFDPLPAWQKPVSERLLSIQRLQNELPAGRELMLNQTANTTHPY